MLFAQSDEGSGATGMTDSFSEAQEHYDNAEPPYDSCPRGEHRFTKRTRYGWVCAECGQESDQEELDYE